MSEYKGVPVRLSERDMLQRCVMGLSEEAGEVAGVVKKHLYYPGKTTAQMKERLLDELGDVLWYLNAICNVMDFTIQQLIDFNVDKLTKRHQTEKEYC